MEHKTPVRDRCIKCECLFRDITKIEGCQSFPVVYALHQQFEQWASNLDVYTGNSNLSLDAKLAYSESLQTLVLELLQTIERNLNRVEGLERTEPNSSLDAQTIIDQMNDTDQDGLSTVLVESLRALESAVESLLRLGQLLHQSSASNLTQRVINFVNRKDDGTLERTIYLHLKHKFHDRAKVDGNRPTALSLCQQLAKSVAFRCFRVHYMRSHADKKRTPPVSHEAPTTRLGAKPPSPSDNLARVPAQSKIVETTQHIAVPERGAVLPPSVLRIKNDHGLVPPRTETDPSLPDSNYVKARYKESKGSFFGANSVASIRLRDDIKYPKKPTLDSSAKSALCPYCCKTFPKSDYDRPWWWERHVDQDLHLYTCIAPECVDPPQLFAKFEEWKTHVDSQHPTGWMSDIHTPASWCCDGDGEHDEMTFDDETSIELHISEQHPEHSEDLELEVWKESCKISTPRPEHACPICNMIPEKISNILKPNDQGQSTVAALPHERNNHRLELLRHVAQHLKEIGLMSIHYLYEEGEEGAGSDMTDRVESRASLAENLKGLAAGKWEDGEWVPDTPIQPCFDKEFSEYDPERSPISELSEPVNWWESDAASDSSYPPDVHVGQLVIAKCVTSQFRREFQFRDENTEFMPEGELSEIINRRVVKGMLGEYSNDETDLKELIDFILEEAIKLFTITMLIDPDEERLYNAMTRFKQHHFSDKNLPVEKPLLFTEEDIDHPALSKLGWKWEKINDFYRRQWTFLAHVIHAATSERRSNADLENPRILPFIERFDDGYNRQAFGQVTKYRVHPRHLDDPEEPLRPDEHEGRCLAVKEIQPRTKEHRQEMNDNWEREANALQKMNDLRQDHIVRFITAFRRSEKGQEDYYLVFEWADGGDLRRLWRTWERPYLTGKLTKAVVKQILGLATALCAAHYPSSDPPTLSFRHGDLKPENILWFRSGREGEGDIGTLKISDWGLAQQHKLETDLRSNQVSMQHGTRRYEPPEEETGQRIGLDPANLPSSIKQQKRQSRLYDVWAMGCITLECIIWLLYGLEGLEQFTSEMRSDANYFAPFFQTKWENGKGKAEIHPVVVGWMNYMAQLPACKPGSTALGGLLELVRTRLLVVNLSAELRRGFLSPNLEPASSNSSIGGPPSSPSKSGMSPRQASALGPGQSGGDSNLDIPQLVVSDADTTYLSQPTTKLETPHASPPRRLVPTSLGRARADEFVEAMKEIYYADEDDESYWGTETYTPDPPLPAVGRPTYRSPPQTASRMYYTEHISFSHLQ